MLDILDGEQQLVGMGLRLAAELAAVVVRMACTGTPRAS
jgi:hypothetical protein